eukprot:m.113518 g.113518  ORF g.113518 m.113518 type:complete len:306 (-) comp9422_c3_seq1:44-961(-)
MAGQHCRFYEAKFPEVDDVVMVNVKSVADMGAYTALLEYDGIEGMILLSELTRRRIRSVNKLIRVGRNECVVVLRVDEEKGYIDLSKRRVSAEEVRACEEKYNKAKAVNSILRYVADKQNVNLEELYEKTAWKLDREMGGAGKAYDAFKLAITDKPEILENLQLEDNVKKALIANIKRKLTPQPVKIRSDIEVACYAYEGVNAVKRALRAGLDVSTEELPVKINLIAPPLYVVTTTALDKEAGIELLKQSLAEIEKVIKEEKGFIEVKIAPHAVTETEDKELAAMMEQYGAENRQVDGDSDHEDD